MRGAANLEDSEISGQRRGVLVQADGHAQLAGCRVERAAVGVEVFARGRLRLEGGSARGYDAAESQFLKKSNESI